MPDLKSHESSKDPPEVDGDWVVDHDTCLACGAPPNEAPDLMHLGTGYGGSYATCYFKKQPETPSEIERACRAAWASCCAAVRYDGDDPAIHKRMRELAPAGYSPTLHRLRDLLTILIVIPLGIAALAVGFIRRLFGRGT